MSEEMGFLILAPSKGCRVSHWRLPHTAWHTEPGKVFREVGLETWGDRILLCFSEQLRKKATELEFPWGWKTKAKKCFLTGMEEMQGELRPTNSQVILDVPASKGSLHKESPQVPT